MKKLDLRSYWRVAAMLVAAAFISLLYFSEHFYDTDRTTSQLETIIKSNDAGRKSQIYLPDGTIVWLILKVVSNTNLIFQEAQDRLSFQEKLILR